MTKVLLKCLFLLTTKFTTMAITISEDFIRSTHLSEEELKIEIAIYLYSKKLFSMGQVKRFASLTQLQFQEELAKRDLNINYTEKELDREFESLDRIKAKHDHNK